MLVVEQLAGRVKQVIECGAEDFLAAFIILPETCRLLYRDDLTTIGPCAGLHWYDSELPRILQVQGSGIGFTPLMRLLSTKRARGMPSLASAIAKVQ